MSRPEDVLREFVRQHWMYLPKLGEKKVQMQEAYTALSALTDELAAKNRWLKIVAQAQHELLDQTKLHMTDDEWAAFSEALGIKETNHE